MREYREIRNERSIECLGVLEYQALDTYEKSAILKRYLYPQNEQAMDMFYLELLQKMTNDLRSYFDDRDEKASQTILNFFAQEAD